MFEEQEDSDVPFAENVFFRAWDIVLLIMNSMLIHQQYIY